MGWADLYTKSFTNQWIDVTGMDDGTYWLEMVVDPFNVVVESNDNNNTEIIVVDLDVPNGSSLVEGTWRFDADGDWNQAINWVGGQSPNASESVAIFGDAINSPTTVTADQTITVNLVQFDNPHGYAVDGPGSIQLAETTGGTAPRVEVIQGDHEFFAEVKLLQDTTIDIASGAKLTFNDPFDLNGHELTKTGPGILKINNDLISAGGLVNVLQGSLAGSGVIVGQADNLGGILSPGNTPSTINNPLMDLPEPATFGWLSCGAATVLVGNRRRRRKVTAR